MLFRIAAFCLFSALALCATTADTQERGVLVYKDGNRITGALVREQGQPIHFVSDRFGILKYTPSEARFEAEREEDESLVYRGKTPALPAAPTPHPPATASAPKAAQKSHSTQSLIHPWKIKLNGYLDKTDDNGTQRREYLSAVRIERHTSTNQLSLDTRYEYTGRNNSIDRRRATSRGDWRHFLTPRAFTLYTPYFEYDGKNTSAGRNDYLLNQQQAGLGYRLLTVKNYDTRIAATWSYFDLRNYDLNTESSFSAPSLILENNLRLPWEFDLRQKGQLYYLPAQEKFGWDNESDLTKKINRTLSLTLRHQYRRDYPALGLNPINRLRLLFGLEF